MLATSGLQASSGSRQRFEGMLVACRETITQSLDSPVCPEGRGLKQAPAALQFLPRATSLGGESRLAATRFRSRRGRKQLLEVPLNSFWVLISFIPSAILVYYVAIKQEERYLERKFGDEYLLYKNKVRRWL